jgi:hypothetical protein
LSTATAEEWWNEVLAICKARGYAEWFYADREAWLEDREEMTPEQAVNYQVECLL